MLNLSRRKFLAVLGAGVAAPLAVVAQEPAPPVLRKWINGHTFWFSYDGGTIKYAYVERELKFGEATGMMPRDHNPALWSVECIRPWFPDCKFKIVVEVELPTKKIFTWDAECTPQGVRIIDYIA